MITPEGWRRIGGGKNMKHLTNESEPTIEAKRMFSFYLHDEGTRIIVNTIHGNMLVCSWIMIDFRLCKRHCEYLYLY